MSGDGAEGDVLVGTATTGPRAALLTRDTLKGDEELKLLWNVSNARVEVVWRFMQQGAMTAVLVWRDNLGPAPRSIV